jgi:hypothetical protein
MRKLEWDNVLFPPEYQLHVLKHFETVDKGYRFRLISITNTSEEQITNLLKIVGSKFFSDFASNPIVLFDWLGKNIINKTISFNDNKCELSILASEKKFPKGIGYDNVIPIDILGKEELALVEVEKRDNFQIFSIHKAAKVQTWQVNCIFISEDDKIIIKTIFPGILAPPLPDRSNQSEEYYFDNINFWNRHAFVK